MNSGPDEVRSGVEEETPRIVISGLDEPEPAPTGSPDHNLSPTDEAAHRHQLQHEREDPEDEDG